MTGKPGPFTPEQRFFAKVVQQGEDPVADCWAWTASLKSGYGQIFTRHGDAPALAHRWSWEFFNGPIPDGLHIDHLRKNKVCVNPWHLEPVTNAENVRRASGWTGGTCRNGHDVTDPNNVYVKPNGTGSICRICKSDWQRRYARAKLNSERVA